MRLLELFAGSRSWGKVAESLGYEVFEIGSIDAVGALIISGISYREGKEAFDKSNNRSDCC